MRQKHVPLGRKSCPPRVLGVNSAQPAAYVFPASPRAFGFILSRPSPAPSPLNPCLPSRRAYLCACILPRSLFFARPKGALRLSARLIPNQISNPEPVVLRRTDHFIPSRLVSSELFQLSKPCQVDGHNSETQLFCFASWGNRRRRSTRRVWTLHMDVGTTMSRILFLKNQKI